MNKNDLDSESMSSSSEEQTPLKDIKSFDSGRLREEYREQEGSTIKPKAESYKEDVAASGLWRGLLSEGMRQSDFANSHDGRFQFVRQ